MRGRRGAEISVTIKDCQIEDIQTLEQLFPVIADEQDLLRSVLTSPNLQASYIAYINGSPAGLAIAWKNSFHPNCTYIRIWTDPIYEQFEGRKKLLQKLRQLKGSPLQTSLWETNTIMKAFYERENFLLIRKTYLSKIDLTQIDMKKFPVSTSHRVGIQIVSLDQIIEDSKWVDQLTMLAKENYVQTHSGNPAGDFDLDTWRNIVQAEDMLTQGSFIYMDTYKQRILAYSFLHDSKTRDTLELGWCGSLEPADIAAIPLLIIRQIYFAKERGYNWLEGEFDSTSPYAMRILETMPFWESEVWLTYQK